jgi:hypothetical protein
MKRSLETVDDDRAHIRTKSAERCYCEMEIPYEELVNRLGKNAECLDPTHHYRKIYEKVLEHVLDDPDRIGPKILCVLEFLYKTVVLVGDDSGGDYQILIEEKQRTARIFLNDSIFKHMLVEERRISFPTECSPQCHIGEITHAQDASNLLKLPIIFIDGRSNIHSDVYWTKKFDAHVLMIHNPMNSSGDFLSLLMAMPNLKCIAIGGLGKCGKKKFNKNLFMALAIYIFDVRAKSKNLSRFSVSSEGCCTYCQSNQLAFLTVLFQLHRDEHFEKLAIRMAVFYGLKNIETKFKEIVLHNIINEYLPMPIAEEITLHMMNVAIPEKD